MLYNLAMIKKLLDRIFKPKNIKPDASKPQQAKSNRPILATKKISRKNTELNQHQTSKSAALTISHKTHKIDRTLLSSGAHKTIERSSGLAVAWRMTPAVTATRPFRREPLRTSAAASSTRPTSRMRTGKPLAFLRMILENSAGLANPVCEVTLNSRWVDSMRPAGTSRLLRRMASSASWVVSL